MGVEIAPDVLDVLAAGHGDGNVFYLAPDQLDRKLYEAVNEVLARIGGTWNRNGKGHVFETDMDAGQLVARVVESREMPPQSPTPPENPTAFFPTPPEVAGMLLDGPGLPRVPDGAARILEPSAGSGALATAVLEHCARRGIDAELDACEVVPRMRDRLKQIDGVHLAGEDFLTYRPDALYDAVVMNPPFAVEGDRLAYLTHISHAWSLLAPGGVLLAVAPGGFIFRDDKPIAALRDLVERCGAWIDAGDGAFKPSGTGVRTVLLGATKTAETDGPELAAALRNGATRKPRKAAALADPVKPQVRAKARPAAKPKREEPEELPPPHVIVAELRRINRQIDREYAALERMLLGDKQLAGTPDAPTLFDELDDSPTPTSNEEDLT